MKTILFTTILLFNVCFNSPAQIKALVHFDMGIYDSSSNQFFKLYENIDHIRVFYKKGKAETLNIYFRKEKEVILGERYVLSFDGDNYLFNKKYKYFSLPNDTKVALTYLQGIQKSAHLNIIAHNSNTTVRRDSTTYHYSFYSVPDKGKFNLDQRDHRPFFKGDVLDLTKKLERDFKTWKPIHVTDSIIIMTGTVDKKGVIGPLVLIEGRSSAYTENILRFMSNEATSWWPKMESTGSVRPWPVRISVRVNKDGSIKVSIL